MTANDFDLADGQELPHEVRKPSFNANLSIAMPLKNGTERKDTGVSANDVSGSRTPDKIPSVTVPNGSPFQAPTPSEEQSSAFDMVEHQLPVLLKPTTDIAATPEDLEQIWEWNSTVPVSVERCVHDLIDERAQAQPSAPAVCAWDGKLTYGELKRLATKLASRLGDLGVGPNILVPLCFEKSMWTSVAILGVLKAGGAFVLLDSSLPEKRLRVIVQQIKAKLILSSPLNRNLSLRLVQKVLTIDIDFFTIFKNSSDDADAERCLESVSPKSLVYAIFTSGSTGTPKGVEICHRNFASAVCHQKDILSFTTESRVFDFSSYSYSTSVSNVLMTLAAGGCLCVPSDSDCKDNLPRSMKALQANTILLTPTVAQFLSPEKLPDLKTVIFVGEALRVTDVNRWWGNVRILNRYGASECAASIAVNSNPLNPEEAIWIGKGVGLVTWVVDPDDHNTLLPLGCVGELVLEGPLICRSYLDDPDRTAAAMIHDPAWLPRGSRSQPGRRGRLFKTGDLVRYSEGGNLLHTGRKDTMVKIRGQRVELGEVERRVQECMPEAVHVVAEVIVPTGKNSSPTVAAFVQFDSKTDSTINGPNDSIMADVRPVPANVVTTLAELLPSYMVPTVLLCMDKLPWTATGKTDRKKLRELGSSITFQQLAEMRTARRGLKQAPQSYAERQMQSIWSHVLGVEADTIGVDDSFFRLGGDSISAMKAVGEARKIGLQLGVADIFKWPKLREVASCAALTSSASTGIPRSQQDGVVEQSFAQESLWFLNQLHPELTMYLMPRAIRIRGPLQLNALKIALLALELRHGTLRTTFGTLEGRNVQQVRPFQQRELKVVDIPSEQALASVLQQDRTTAFSLDTQPGWRVSVYRLGEQLHVLSIVMHHIVSDGWSVDVLRRELASFYLAAIRGEDPLSQIEPLPIQYYEYAAWQKERDQSVEHQRQLDYWATQLSGSRPATLLCDKPRPAALTGRAEVEEYRIKGVLFDRLRSFCKSRETTPFIVLLAAFRATHFRLTGVNDATIGTVNANRDRWELKDIIGFFVNMQCIRTRVEGDSFEELLRQVHDAVVASFANKDVPFEKIVSKLQPHRDLSCHPLVQIGFGFHPQSNLGNFTLEGLETESIAIPAMTRFDLEFHFYQEEGSLRGQLVFSTELYQHETISNMLSIFDKVLEQGLTESSVAIESLSLFTDKDYSALDSMGLIQVQTTDYPRDSSIVDVFCQQAAACPDRVAVKDFTNQLTYAQLQQESNAIARWLTLRSLEPETLIGVIATRSCHAVVAFLGILKANLAYVPLNVKIPSARAETILSSIQGQKLVLVGPDVQPPAMQHLAVEFVNINDILQIKNQKETSSQNTIATSTPTANSLAYVMFTSGSTGLPKGVMVEHRGIMRMVKQNNMVQYLPEAAVMAHIANIDFDMSTTEIYAALLNGGTLICIGFTEVVDSIAMAEVLSREKIDTLIITPALMKQYLRDCPTAFSMLQALYVGGDRAQVDDFLLAQQLVRGKVFNGYGPTENSGVSTIYCLPERGSYVNGVPIGRALSNSGAYVMDTQQRLVPLGVLGELVVTGDGLARGYTDPRQNANRFISVVVGGEEIRAYRTGDCVCYRPVDGQLEFFNRLDGQVKIRGQRVELGEIEHLIRSHGSVDDAVAVVHEDDQDMRVVSFVTIRKPDAGPQDPTESDRESEHGKEKIRGDISEMLKANLANYMVPQVMLIDKIPLNENGKVDRRALEKSYQPQQAQRSQKEQPISDDERQLQGAWARVLSIEPATIGRDDSFFQLGGDSIAAMRVASEMRNEGVRLAVADMFRFPKLHELANKGIQSLEESQERFSPFSLLGGGLDRSRFIQDIAQRHLHSDKILDAYSCTPLQAGLISLTLRTSGDYITQNVLELAFDISVKAFRAAWEYVVRATPTLRTRVIQHSDLGLVQVVLDEDIQWISATSGLKEYLQTDREQSMKLEDSLTRFALVSDGTESPRWFVFTIHHALYDGFSMPRILEAVYQAYQHKSIEPTTQFQVFIEYVRSQEHNEDVSSYWKQTLADYEDVPFPPLPPSISQPSSDRVVDYELVHPVSISHLGFTASTLVRAAWALVVGRMTSTDDVVYGATVSGRSAPITSPDKIMGPTIATVPVRIGLAGGQTVPAFIETVQRQAVEMISFEQAGLQRIAKISPAAHNACMFQTLLVIQPQDHRDNSECILGKWQNNEQHYWTNTYALTLKIQLGTNKIRVLAEFDSRVIEPWIVENMLQRLDFTLRCLDLADTEQKLADLKVLTPQDLETIWGHNHTCPLAIEESIDQMIAKQVKAQPSATAVCAWDAELTYSKLDELATKLASALIDLGVGPTVLVPLCFEKSMWVIVALLGVVKAGGAFVLLDPSLPEQRLRTVVQQVNGGAFVLSSLSAQELSERLAQKTIALGWSFFTTLENQASRQLPPVDPSSILYVVFTSGSTGTPKGVMVTHTNAASSIFHQAEDMAATSETRILDFASYSFDTSISNILTALTRGGCLCIPSEDDRVNNLEQSIISLRATNIDITPSVAQALSLDRILPTVRTIIFGGESLSVKDMEKWWGKVQIIHVYGPCECTPTSTINSTASSSDEAMSIGKGKGLVTWIVDPEDHNSLLPPGCVGELLLEGPLVSRGYLKDPEKTAASFIEDPIWLLRGAPGRSGRHGRLYKTGDLVRYKSDGNLIFITRKDAQVKIRGQRIELGDVEYWVQVCVPGALSVVAEVIKLQGGSSSQVLAVFVQMNGKQLNSNQSGVMVPEILPIPAEVEDRLAEHLPVYMVPKIFFSLPELPLTTTGKKDRKRLREMGSLFSIEELAEAQTANRGPKRQPTCETERSMQKLWAQVLNIDASKIGLDDSFFYLGGDSIIAMHLVAEARKMNLGLEVADIFRFPRLQGLANQSVQTLAETIEEIPSFNLLDRGIDVSSLLHEVSSQHNLRPNDICDIYPCTPLQEGLISLTIRRAGDYIAQVVLELDSTVVINILCSALEQVSRAMPILRTRLIQCDDLGFAQVVLNEHVSWVNAIGLEDYLIADRKHSMNLGEPLTRYALVSDGTSQQPRWFVWTLHHALYDGWSMPRIIDAIYRAYQGELIKPPPQFQGFIKYIRARDDIEVSDYWQRTLGDCECRQFPALSPSFGQPLSDSVITHCLSYLQNTQLGTTISILIRAAWALVVGKMTGSDDVVFGVTLSGRNAPVVGLDEMTGPTIATVPVRVQLAQNQSISDYLDMTQRQATEMIPFEQTGLHRIADFSPSLRKACDFQTLLVVQPQDKKSEKGLLGEWRNGSQEHVFNTYALTLELHLEADGIVASAMFDSRALEPWMARGLLERLEQVMYQLSHLPPSQLVADVEILTSQDLDRIWDWNSVVPITIERLVKEAIEDNVQSRPSAPAVCAWDGKLTYSALDQLATKLARKLISFGIEADMLVPLCFEKSMWTTVAILGVIKASGAFVLLDPSLPEQRLQGITQQLKASVILSSTSNGELSSRLAQRVIILNWSFFTATDFDGVSENTQRTHPAHPASLSYAVFTSGSTGMPKGVLITNANAASALHHQIECMGINESSRIFDFASYSFDVSVSNVLSALTAGGCLCVPSDEDRRDSLEQSIASLQANILDITPSIAQVLSVDRIPSVNTLIFGGETLHLVDIKRWWGKVQIIHIYGPCECTPTSTINCNSAASPDEAVHIGKGVGLVTWIVDPEDHEIILPPGCTGELLLEGPLVGRGYLNDPTKTAAAFIEDPTWLLRGTSSRPGRRGRLFKTGDLVRYTRDGYLKFVGRKQDTQVKIRGQRLELGEIEHALRNHASVDESVAALQHEDGQESRIVSFVTVHDGDVAPEVQPDEGAEVQHTEQWKAQFDSEYVPIMDIKADSIGRDFMGWTSMYDGSDIDIGEMNEWLDATIETILNGGEPDHVLEIGTGSGMILFNLLKGLESYTGLEPSRYAVDFVTHTSRSIEGLANKVKVFEASAADLGRLPIRFSPNLVVINSVAQYFPSQDYLFRVIQDLLELKSVKNKTLFFGDIRSYPLHREFLVARALYIAEENAGKDEIRRIVDDLERAESELLIDPGFFTSLPCRLPGKIAHVEILPKRMRATNELSCYRYDAVIHARGNDFKEQQQVQDINDDEWIDFREQQLNRQSLLELLQRSTASSVVLAVGNIPYRKILFERHVVDLLDEQGQAAHTEENWLSFARASMQSHPSLAAIDLVEIAAQAGCQVEISWARQHSQRGALDAIFRRHEPSEGRRRIQFRFPTDHRSRTHQPFTNQPLRQQRRQKIQDELYAMLKSQLPPYMVPQVIEILDSMPLNLNGKTDRQALVKSLESRESRTTVRGPIRQPASEAQRQMLEVWGRVLNIETSTIGLDNSFFHLGGSSIAAMKVVAEARKIGMKLTVADIFRYPVLHELVDQSHHEPVVDNTRQLIAPFALLYGKCDLNSALRELCSQYHLDQTDDQTDNTKIRDAYPCTPLQEGLMSLTSKSPGSYIGQNVLELAPDISVKKLCAAWEQVVRDLPILRTRLVHHDRLGLAQIVVDEPIHWVEANSLNDYLEPDIEQPMDLGQPLARYALVKGSIGTPKWFVWTIHHALYDGWSMPLILDAVKRAYQGEPVQQGPQFQAFIKYIKNQDNKMMKDYWFQALDDCQCAPFPSLPPHIEQPTADKIIEHSFKQPQSNRLGITPPIMIRAAWALLVGRMASADDVVFGVTLSGRNAPLAGIEMMAGPTFATVPVRVKWKSSDRAEEYLKAVQQQATGMIAYEQIGLHKLAELSPEARQACMFQTLLVVQPPDESCTSDVLGRWRNDIGRGKRFDSYGLMLVVQLSADKVSVSASFDSRMIEPWLVDKLLRRLGHVVSQLDRANPELLLSEVETVMPEDLEQIWHWNHTVPAAAEQCVHKLFEQRAQAQPKASAVCAWDGEWTYGELDEASTRLAYHLISLGVGLERIVPLCFEKSRWTPVVMLAVMKAGGASVAMDSAQPEERLRTIVQQTKPALVLSSSANREMASRLSGQQVVVVDESLLQKLNSTDATSQLPAVTPSNKLYIAFTSGSTGMPKGAVITHSNFSSAIQHVRNSSFSRLEPTARVYDFASYAFDISWFNALQSLTSGACLCIPSEADRTDDLAGSIHRLRATFAILTPSTASLLPSETIHYLQTLMLAGEALPSEYTKRWVGLTQVKNGYGPCECTPITAVAAIDRDNVVASSIGTGLGVNTWVVQASNHNSLVPIGDIGELVLEGPLVGSGYLGDAEKTAAAFIRDPTWLRHGTPGRSGRQGRLYKTGDLVRYNPDGSLVFIGRKDATQVKIRGQRVELGEVEHHVHACVPAARQVVAEVIMPANGDGQGRPTLAAFLVFDDKGSLSPVAQAMSIPAEVDHELAKRLPGYMVPTAYFSLNKLPINSSGKVDRHRLRDIGAGFTVQQLAEPRNASLGDKRAPATKTERALQQIWARVLGINAASIGADDSFFRLGGDSITAMQASAAARGLNMGISTADILRSKTISVLAAATSVSKHHLLDLDFADTKADDGQPFGLSPIQQLYVATQPDPNKCFDQNFFLKLREPITFTILAKAIETIVMRHPMLRARFSRTSKGEWKQRIIDDVFNSFHLCQAVGTTSVRSTKAGDMRQCRERLNIETGPLSAAVLFEDAEGQSLFIAIHHLVIDLVSWRVLLEELEELLTRRQLSATSTTSFRTWCSLQARYAAENRYLQEAAPSQVQPSPLSYWDLGIGINVQGATASREFVLDEESSTAILGACNEAFGTRPVELMIAALVHSFSAVFANRPLPTIFSEGHGREPWDDRIDLSRTVGWFTTISPAFTPTRTVMDLLDTIRYTKDSVRRLPKNGWSYFTSKFADETNATTNAADFPVEVMFNYAGSYQQLERGDSFFESLSISENCYPESWLKLRRLALFEFNAHMDRGRLAVALEYPKGVHHSDMIEAWVDTYEATLTHLGALLKDRSSEWTLTDFPMAFTSYADMHEFRSVVLPRLGITSAQDIEDIYPCTGLQEGLLVAQGKSLNNYRVILDFEIIATQAPGDGIDPSRIERAWRAVVRRHGLLRTILVDMMPGSSRTMHVILKNPTPSISYDQCAGETGGDRGLNSDQMCLKYRKYDLQHHLSVSRIDEKHVHLCFELNHAILDGHSTGVMLRDFWQAYNGTLSLDGPLYGDFIRYVEKRPRDADREFWVKYLDGVQPCLFPSSKAAKGQTRDFSVAVPGLDKSRIHDFCSIWEVTTASVIQTAWALVLYHFTGSATPCFGNLASGRDVPVDRVGDMFGPIIGMIPYRVRLNGGHSVIETLREAHKDFIDSLPHQTYALMEVHEALHIGSSGLFNSILSFQRVIEQPSKSTDGHTIQERGGHDPVEVSISSTVTLMA